MIMAKDISVIYSVSRKILQIEFQKELEISTFIKSSIIIMRSFKYSKEFHQNTINLHKTNTFNFILIWNAFKLHYNHIFGNQKKQSSIN